MVRNRNAYNVVHAILVWYISKFPLITMAQMDHKSIIDTFLGL